MPYCLCTRDAVLFSSSILLNIKILRQLTFSSLISVKAHSKFCLYDLEYC
jgi:hypothetical protein